MSAGAPFAAEVRNIGRHGGLLMVHRFGTAGRWPDSIGRDDFVTVTEILDERPDQSEPLDPHCPHCASIVTGLRISGEFAITGITHSPGCPWLDGQAAGGTGAA